MVIQYAMSQWQDAGFGTLQTLCTVLKVVES